MKISLPNQITIGRLGLVLLFFVLLSWFHAGHEQQWLLLVCFWLFLIAALGDILDGLLARWLKQVTSFGRVVDPVADKVMVCGAFVLFAGPNFVNEGVNITDVSPWMVVVILIREFLVSAIRAHAESEGTEFGAAWAGKLKMFVQSATICIILGQLGWDLPNLAPMRTAAVWITVLITVLSAIVYVRRAHAFLLSGHALSGAGEPEPLSEPTVQPAPPTPTDPAPPAPEDKAEEPKP